MSGSIWTAIGLVLVIEGLTYALVPSKMNQLMATMQNLSDEQLRITGTAVLAVGVMLVFVARQLMGG